ncbi:unnamed protein product [Ascophyllum nodosum]
MLISLARLLGPATAFVAPPLSLPLTPLTRQAQSCSTSSRPSRMRAVMSMVDSDTDADTSAEQKATRLRETAAAFRAQVAVLEDQKAQQRRTNADRSFKSFAKDGVVGTTELQAGLEGSLRKTFIQQLAVRMGRKPSPEEIDEKISELPGGCLFPDDLARRLLEVYDTDGDGLLRQSEFAPEEELRTRLESMFRERREEQLEVRKKERERELEAKRGAEARLLGDKNDAAATVTERVLCALPYFLPLSDGIVYARHLYETFPQQLGWTEPIAVAMIFYRNLPFATLAAFFGMSLLSRSPQVNKLLRFNLIQAINFDIALIVPSLVGPLARWSLGNDAYKLVPITDALSDVLFVALLVAIVYSVATSAVGTFPNELPLFGPINRENPDKN